MTAKTTVCVEFDRKIKLEFQGPTVTSDAGLLAYRELDHALRLWGKIVAIVRSGA